MLLKIFKQWLVKHRFFSVRMANFLNRAGVFFQILSRRVINHINSDTADQYSDWFLLNRSVLSRKIDSIIKTQQKEYKHYSYFYGYPYQSFATLGVFGDRSTEERYYLYKLEEYLTKDDRILDLGCNCGFVGIYVVYRIGCAVTGIDINPYAIEIGKTCAEYLKISQKVELKNCTIQELDKNLRFSSIFSFATHWTGDGNYRVQLLDHFQMIHGLLEQNGLLFFESHCADVGNPDYYETISRINDKFHLLYSTNTDANSRHFYVWRKI